MTDLEDEEPIALYAQLIDDTRSLGVSMIERDGTEAGFRAARIVNLSRSNGLKSVEMVAEELVQRLADAMSGDPTGVGMAYERLCQTLDQLLEDEAGSWFETRP